LNSPPPSSSFVSFSPCSLNSFDRSHFSIFIREYIIFPLHSLSHTLSLHPLSYHCTNLQTEPLLPSCSLLLKKSIFVCLRQLYRDFHYEIPATSITSTSRCQSINTKKCRQPEADSITASIHSTEMIFLLMSISY
jgi:hypothetical protein